VNGGWLTPERRSVLMRLRLPLGLLVFTHLLGMVGFSLEWRDVPDATAFDALYMTFITISTIGFAELHPMGPSGRVLVMLVAATGMGSLFYTFTVVLEYASSDAGREARRRRKMQSTIEALSGHFIVAGIGRVGREAAAELANAKVPFVLVDPSEAVVARAAQFGCAYVRGDATEDATLLAAGITRAKGLIVTTSSDATNLYVILSARLLNAKLHIASRAVDESSVPKLLRAGANRAISPYAIGGKRLAQLQLRPGVVDFFDTALNRGDQRLSIEDMQVPLGARAVGRSLEELRLSAAGVSVLAVVREGAPIPNPPADTKILGGDLLLLLGTDEQLRRAEQSLLRA
jgi:voltage-gated potassium channel